MRVVSWNMSGRKSDDAWRHLLDVLRPDVALLQEAAVSDTMRAELGGRLIWQPISNVKWGSAIVTTTPATHVEVELSTEWMDYVRLVATDAVVDSKSLRIISVHPHHMAFDEELLPEHPELTPRLDGARSVWSCDVAYALARDLTAAAPAFVVGGDWNTARLFDRTMGYLEPGAGEAFFARANADGWHDCYHARHGREGRTWIRGKDNGYQLDHVFTDGVTGEAVKDCWIDERAAVDPRLSDHAPLIVDFEAS